MKKTELNEKFIIEVFASLFEKIGKRAKKCSECKSDELYPSPLYLIIPSDKELIAGEQPTGGSVFIQLTCVNCGYSKLFNPVVLTESHEKT